MIVKKPIILLNAIFIALGLMVKPESKTPVDGILLSVKGYITNDYKFIICKRIQKIDRKILIVVIF